MLQLADKVELMLREAILTFDDARRRRDRRRRRRWSEEVDADQEAIKLYLARLMQRELTAEESAQVLEAVLFTTNLEHIGDIIDKGLLRLAAKKRKQGLRFSDDGWRDIRAFHALIAEQMRRALAVFVSRDAGRGARPRRREGPAARRGVARQRAALPPAARRAAGDDRDQRAASRRAARPEADQRPPDHGRLSDPGADRRAARLAAARAAAGAEAAARAARAAAPEGSGGRRGAPPAPDSAAPGSRPRVAFRIISAAQRPWLPKRGSSSATAAA